MFIYLLPEKKLAYLAVHKVATNSIARSFFESSEERERLRQERKKGEFRKGGVSGWGIMIALVRDRMPNYSDNDFAPDLIGIKGIYYREKRDNKKLILCGFDEGTGYNRRVMAIDELNSYFTFTFVRNPFTRLVSCFQQRFAYNEDQHKFMAVIAMEDFVTEVKDFADFIHHLPTKLDYNTDIHIRTQAGIAQELEELGGKIKFVGKMENFSQDFEGIRQKYNLLPVEKKNVSEHKALHKNWRDYYTPELAHIVYERYREDFKRFGYEAEYPKLLDYLSVSSSIQWRKRYLLAKLGIRRYKRYF